FGGDLLAAAGVTPDEEAGRRAISKVLQDGSAMERFERMIAAQGALDPRAPLEQSPDLAQWTAPREGYLTFHNLRDVGLAVAALGGGRTNAKDQIDHAVGIVSHKFRGERVRAGEAIATIHHRAGVGLEECLRLLGRGISLEPEAISPQPLVLERVLPRPTTSP
ncbi:MAG: pyrimidine-nucleoside phosphorylase, partial [Planctomycetota bacterium]|nr:pyrimidine-nucleoside phosphorylase [Planctomycetota bacterium]